MSLPEIGERVSLVALAAGLVIDTAVDLLLHDVLVPKNPEKRVLRSSFVLSKA